MSSIYCGSKKKWGGGHCSWERWWYVNSYIHVVQNNKLRVTFHNLLLHCDERELSLHECCPVTFRYSSRAGNGRSIGRLSMTHFTKPNHTVHRFLLLLLLFYTCGAHHAGMVMGLPHIDYHLTGTICALQFQCWAQC